MSPGACDCGHPHSDHIDEGKCLYLDCECSEYFEHDPAPYCSYGHRSKATCDCGPIAENE